MEEEKQLSPSMKYWAKHKINTYPCPECGRTVNKTTVLRHSKTRVHRQAAAIKELTDQVGQLSTV